MGEEELERKAGFILNEGNKGVVNDASTLA